MRNAFLGALASVVVLLMPAYASPYKEKTLHQFCSLNGCQDGAYPAFGLVSDSKGNLYGVTTAAVADQFGGGTVYQLSHAGSHWNLKVLYTFKGADRGENSPSGG